MLEVTTLNWDSDSAAGACWRCRRQIRTVAAIVGAFSGSESWKCRFLFSQLY